MIYLFALGCFLPFLAVFLRPHLRNALPVMIALYWTIVAGVLALSAWMSPKVVGGVASANIYFETGHVSYTAQICVMFLVASILFTILNLLDAHLAKTVPVIVIAICHLIVSLQAGILLFPRLYFGAPAQSADQVYTAFQSLSVVLAIASTLTVLTYLIYFSASLASFVVTRLFHSISERLK